MDYNSVQELVQCYAKATEIYSRDANDSEFMIFTVKTQSLLGREDIQAVLDSNRNVNLLQMEQADTKRAPNKTTQSTPNSFLSMDIAGGQDAKKAFMFREPSDEEEEEAHAGGGWMG